MDTQKATRRTSNTDLSTTADANAPQTSLFDAAAKTIVDSIGADPDADVSAIETLPLSILSRAFGENWDRLPYSAFCAARSKAKVKDGASNASLDGLFSVDPDEW